MDATALQKLQLGEIFVNMGTIYNKKTMEVEGYIVRGKLYDSQFNPMNPSKPTTQSLEKEKLVTTPTKLTI